MSKFGYDMGESRISYQLLGDDILYNLIINLRMNGMSFGDLAHELGISTEELLGKLTDKKVDVFVGIESINVLQQLGIYNEHSRLSRKALCRREPRK